MSLLRNKYKIEFENADPSDLPGLLADAHVGALSDVDGVQTLLAEAERLGAETPGALRRQLAAVTFARHVTLNTR